MPYIINGHVLLDERIKAEEKRIAGQPHWKSISDESERANRIRAAAEETAVAMMLIEQAGAIDPRPVDPRFIDQVVEREKTAGGCRRSFDDSLLRQTIERSVRTQRIQHEMIEGVLKPSPEEIEAVYQSLGPNFQNPELFEAAHIVRHVDREHSEEDARAGIELALTELQRGEPFAEVVARHSDCKDKGGDLGQFPTGHMVQEFEDALRSLEPGQRTGIIRTPFGFHIAELRARIPACQASFEEVKGDIARVLELQKKHEAFLRGVAELRARADILYFPDEQTANAPT